MKHQDQLNRIIKLSKIPQRIVSLVPSQTELLVDLNLEASIIGVTKFCVHPNHLRQEKKVVGGTKQVQYDKIKALQPDIILCNKEENTQEMILALESIAPVHVSSICDLDGALELIKMYGRLFSIKEKADDLITTIQSEYQKFSTYIKHQPKLKVAYFIWKDPWMVAANSTFIDAMLRLNNYENYFAKQERYPEIDLLNIDESIDAIFLSSEPFPFKASHIEDLKKILPHVKIQVVNGEYFSWYGSRLIEAFSYFRTLHKIEG
ncbi:ABC-type Fe3+-hydroxamate transport system, substrate-binding protein [Formosa sp. Hel1_31_208]|uniref:ABC transporter substrate-binding protein n=1 Tax=Formosa sp. Hel1_31_208 TaxID=1798225 RepID=UPI00087D719B|nr:helical backbone metal receptor [Formosa sp. Hel1_31_208]SDS11938.1 ABC-type Fe3+-hydroxamate transport system, substrate-binding protein [Formosa sp. Hel1_31_208]